MNVNKVMLMGRLTADPELKTSQSGVSVSSFTVAVQRKYSKENTVTDFIDCVAFRSQAEFLSKYFRKGASIIVFGSIQIETWKDKDGNNRKTTKIVADEVQFGESKKSNTSVAYDDNEAASVSDSMFSEVKGAELPFNEQEELPF